MFSTFKGPSYNVSACIGLKTISKHHFFPKSRNVDPPIGTAVRGPAISHTVNVICELRGRSQYLIGNVIHSFHLHSQSSVMRCEVQSSKDVRIIILKRLEACSEWYGQGFIICNKLASDVEV
jgi:hypothetical protein